MNTHSLVFLVDVECDLHFVSEFLYLPAQLGPVVLRLGQVLLNQACRGRSLVKDDVRRAHIVLVLILQDLDIMRGYTFCYSSLFLWIEANMLMYLRSIQTWNVRQADTDLFQVVTMPTFVFYDV